MTVTISLSSEQAPVAEDAIVWICILCISGSDNTVSLAIDEFNAATGH